jgi:acetolactate synthase small subunit
LATALKKFGATLIQCKDDTGIIEAVGDQHQVKELLEGVKGFGIKELIRTGRIALAY